ncbi:MAG: hypothetical protein V1800_16560 [Candidatus Latescibacterota bacterium]
MRRLLLMLVAVALSGFLAGCSEDNNPAGGDDFGEVSGTITFTGTWPTTGDVQVSIWTSFPPAGPPAGATDPLAAGDLIAYKIEGLSKGTYQAVTVGWREATNPAGAKVLGIYWAYNELGVDDKGLPTVNPVPVEISDAKMDWSGIDMMANLDIAP